MSIIIRNESDKTVEILTGDGSKVLFTIPIGSYITTTSLDNMKIPTHKMKIVNGVIKIKGV